MPSRDHRPGPVVRRLEPDDWDLARALRLAALTADPRCFGEAYDAAAARDEGAWRAQLEDTAAWFAAYCDSSAGASPVGLAVFYPTDTYPDGAPQLGAMWVEQAWRRRGVAAALAAAVHDAARATGATAVGLWVTAGNDAARSAYRRLGYRETGATKPAPRDPAVPMHRMLRDVGPARLNG